MYTLSELPHDMNISPIFNVENLFFCGGTLEPPPILSNGSAGTQLHHAFVLIPLVVGSQFAETVTVMTD